VVAGCGGGGEPSVEFRGSATSTTFVTLPPPSSTTTPPATSPPAQQPSGDERDEQPTEEPDPVDPLTGNRLYEVQRNDYLLRIATRFDTTPEAIAEVNGWSSVQHNINPGDTIQIPPVEDPDASEPDTASATESSEPSAQECADGSEPQTYTIQRGDIPARVAARFDVTVAELRAANVDTPNYNAFVVGVEINIPC
jgi:LysM repeat protein